MSQIDETEIGLTPTASEAEEFGQDDTEEEPGPCADCGGTGQNLINPDDGGSCPSCINGRRI